MATFNATFNQNATFKTSLKESGNLKTTFGDVQRVEASDYNKLSNKPSIERVILEGDKTFKQLGLEVLSIQEIEKILYLD